MKIGDRVLVTKVEDDEKDLRGVLVGQTFIADVHNEFNLKPVGLVSLDKGFFGAGEGMVYVSLVAVHTSNLELI